MTTYNVNVNESLTFNDSIRKVYVPEEETSKLPKIKLATLDNNRIIKSTQYINGKNIQNLCPPYQG